MSANKYFPLYGPQSITLYTNVEASDESYKAYHTLERILFCKLLLILNRIDPTFDETVCSEIMGFWMFLEREGFVKDLIYDILRCPNILIAMLTNEAVTILNCLKSDRFDLFRAIEVPFTRNVSIHGSISLLIFFHNRVVILEKYEKIFNRVCPRVFNDLSKQGASAFYNHMVKSGVLSFLPTAPPLEFHGLNQSGLANTVPTRPPPRKFRGSSSQNPTDLTLDLISFLSFMKDDDQNPTEFTLDLTSFLSFLNDHDHEMAALSSSTTSGARAAKNEPLVDQSNGSTNNRTIFLTFSKGYPISRNELIEFFTRMCGTNCIEALRMQEVESGRQPLYARLIVKSRKKMGMILENKDKMKFNINGKHVWARKYMPKHTRAASSSTQ